MKKHKLINYYILTALVVLFFFGVSYVAFFKKVVFYKPFRVEVKGVNAKQFSEISCMGYSPLNKLQSINKNPANFTFSSDYYYHLKEIMLEIPLEIYDSIDEIVFISGKTNEVLPLSQIISLKDSSQGGVNEGSYIVNLSQNIKPDINIFLLYATALLWQGPIRILYMAVLILLGILSFIFLRRRLKMASQEVAGHVFRFLFISLPSAFHKKQYRFLLVVFLIVLYAIIFFSRSTFTGANFSLGEFWYQSSAVNFSKGYGISRVGALEPFEAYKFSEYGIDLEFNYRAFTRLPGIYIYHSPPLYGMFLGTIYYFAGVDPQLAKVIQLLMLIIMAAYIPLLCYKFWKITGLFCGITASFIFLQNYYQTAAILQPQTLMFFLCFLIVVAVENFITKPSYLRIFILGIVISCLVLTKVTLILLPFLFLLYLGKHFYKTRNKQYLYFILTFFSIIIIPVLLWSFYTKTHQNNYLFAGSTFEKVKYNVFESPLSADDTTFLNPLVRADPSLNDLSIVLNDGGEVADLKTYNELFLDLFGRIAFNPGSVFLASQIKKTTLLYAHNEYINDGDFSAAWTRDKNSFYQTDNMSEYPPWVRVVNFYIHHPGKIISLPMQKLYKAFKTFKFLNIFLMAFIINFLLFVFEKKYVLSKRFKIGLFFIMNALFLLTLNYVFTRWLYYGVVAAAILIVLYSIVFKIKSLPFHVPLSFTLLSLGMMLMTIMISGEKRLVEVIDFVFIMSGVFMIVQMNIKWVFSDISLKSSIFKNQEE